MYRCQACNALCGARKAKLVHRLYKTDERGNKNIASEIDVCPACHYELAAGMTMRIIQSRYGTLESKAAPSYKLGKPRRRVANMITIPQSKPTPAQPAKVKPKTKKQRRKLAQSEPVITLAQARALKAKELDQDAHAALGDSHSRK